MRLNAGVGDGYLPHRLISITVNINITVNTSITES